VQQGSRPRGRPQNRDQIMTAGLKILTVLTLLAVSALCLGRRQGHHRCRRRLPDRGGQIHSGRGRGPPGFPRHHLLWQPGRGNLALYLGHRLPHAFRIYARGQSRRPLFGGNHPGASRDLQPGRRREEFGDKPAPPEPRALRLSRFLHPSGFLMLYSFCRGWF
jgi:hypothetical protein